MGIFGGDVPPDILIGGTCPLRPLPLSTPMHGRLINIEHIITTIAHRCGRCSCTSSVLFLDK